MAEETNKNEAGDAIPSTTDEKAPEVAKKKAPKTDSPEATDIPSANAPDPEALSGDNPNAAKAKPAAKEAAAKADKPAAKKKEKPPAVEDKPFEEFMRQDYVPALQEAIAGEGVEDLHLDFAKQKLSIPGYDKAEECWQVLGSFGNGMRQFNVYFPDEDIKGKKAFSCNEGKRPSTLESFLIDERRITLDLMVFGVVQRLNGQKWLGRN